MSFYGVDMDKKVVKDIKRFAIISNIALNVFTTIILGVGLGLLLDYLFDTRYIVVITSLLFIFAAIYNLIKTINRLTGYNDKKNNHINNNR